MENGQILEKDLCDLKRQLDILRRSERQWSQFQETSRLVDFDGPASLEPASRSAADPENELDWLRQSLRLKESTILRLKEELRRSQSMFHAASEALKESRRALNTLMSNLPGLVYRAKNDRDWSLEYITEDCERITGYSAEELLAKKTTFARLIHPEDQDRLWEEVQEAVRKNRSFELNYRIRTKTGEEKWIWERGRAVLDPEGAFAALEGFLMDVTESRKLEALLRRLPRRTLEAQEAERRRVARELHDGVNQLLSSARFRIQAIEENFPDGNKDFLESIQAAKRVLQQAVHEVGRISSNLRPSELDDFGLASALRSVCEDLERRSHLKVRYDICPFSNRLPPEMELHLYRIAQEAITNVEKHAQAACVRIRFLRHQETLRLSIKDDGIGMDAGAARTHSEPSGAGMGLAHMKERAHVINGKLLIESSPGNGALISIEAPIKQQPNLTPGA